MNIILFEADETARPLALDDRRARHVLDVLRRGPGDSFDAGLIGGSRGKAVLEAVDASGLHLRFEWVGEPPALEPVILIVGMPRPQTARKVLQEASALGVEAMHFVRTERGDPGYGGSRLWSSGEWRRHLIAGAEQAFTTRLPEVTWGQDLQEAIAGGAEYTGTRLALDNYEAPAKLSSLDALGPVTIAVGPERGWSESERAALRSAGYRFAHLGARVLRVETACVAAVVLVLSRLGRM
jgi:16S rRNA (uracil1498-N3)-methyltransferase